jgi:ribosomal protein L29
MATKKTKTTTKKSSNPLVELRKKYAVTRVDIRAGREKNTNAHKSIKKQIAQELTKLKK